MIDITDLPPRLSVEQIRTLRTCHPSTIIRARKLGLIQGFKIGKTTWLYDRDSVLKWLHLGPEPEPPQDSRSGARPSKPKPIRTKIGQPKRGRGRPRKAVAK